MRGATMPLSPGGSRRSKPSVYPLATITHESARGRERQQRDHVVGNEDADDVGVVRGLEVVRLEAVGLGLLAGVVAAHAHDGLAAAVAQVERPRPALVAVADDRDRSPAIAPRSPSSS